ncbi:porimin isoform X4 [Oxyura jamaicensis]|uniref:porimin isoform X4 n=1 Tax=Oxyura jamaicensis TaxID=8884 RepID=UPI0015A546CA|nr:porimin isoform X4 [Oxyura jamaicensis]
MRLWGCAACALLLFLVPGSLGNTDGKTNTTISNTTLKETSYPMEQDNSSSSFTFPTPSTQPTSTSETTEELNFLIVTRYTCQYQPAHHHHDVHHCDYSSHQYQPNNNFNYDVISHIFTSQYYNDHFQDSSHFCNSHIKI